MILLATNCSLLHVLESCRKGRIFYGLWLRVCYRHHVADIADAAEQVVPTSHTCPSVAKQYSLVTAKVGSGALRLLR